MSSGSQPDLLASLPKRQWRGVSLWLRPSLAFQFPCPCLGICPSFPARFRQLLCFRALQYLLRVPCYSRCLLLLLLLHYYYYYYILAWIPRVKRYVNSYYYCENTKLKMQIKWSVTLTNLFWEMNRTAWYFSRKAPIGNNDVMLSIIRPSAPNITGNRAGRRPGRRQHGALARRPLAGKQPAAVTQRIKPVRHRARAHMTSFLQLTRASVPLDQPPVANASS